MNNEKLRKEYREYRANGGEEPFGQWCAFVKPLPEKEIRQALLFTKRMNKEFIDSQKDTVWTPDGRVKMNPEYIKNAIRLRAFQKAQREADPEWMAHDRFTKKLQDDPIFLDLVKTMKNPVTYCTACMPQCCGHRRAEYEENPNLKLLTKKQNPIIKWFKRKKKEYADRRRLKAFRSGE